MHALDSEVSLLAFNLNNSKRDVPPALLMDLRHDHGTLIHVVRACDNADAPDLVAIGGENSVSVLLIVCPSHFAVHRCLCSPSTRECYRPTRLQT